MKSINRMYCYDYFILLWSIFDFANSALEYTPSNETVDLIVRKLFFLTFHS